MKKEKDISTLFRESSEKLTVQPSSQSWDKLESRLDAQQNRRTGKVVPLRWMSIAAALLVLVAATYFWNASRTNAEMVNGDRAMPEFLEVLKPGEDCNPYCALMESRRKLPADYARTARWEN